MNTSNQTFSRDYFAAFQDYAKSGKPSAALTEGSDAAGGGYAIPSVVDGQIIALAPDTGAVRRLASVIPTTSDILFNAITTPSMVTAKVQLSPFGTSSLQFNGGGTIKLSAFMAGVMNQLSMEVAQDYPAYLNALSVDFIPAQSAYEEGKFLSGSGVGEPQGMIGRIGAGVTASPDAAGNLVTIEATEDLIETLPAKYHEDAAWLMARSTARILRRAQRQAGITEQLWTRENGQDFFQGYPVGFSEAVPTAAPGAVPLLFGSFAAGYIIGDRGGPGVRVKVLDQIDALAGLVDFLTYRRCDGRVKIPEAVQQLSCAAL